MGRVASIVFCWSKPVTGASPESRGMEIDPQLLRGEEAKDVQLSSNNHM